MSEENKIERILIPYFGENLPKKAEEKAFEKLEKEGKIFLLHITDEAPTRSIRYRTGQMGEESETIKIFRETQKKFRKKQPKNIRKRSKKEPMSKIFQ